MAPASFAPPRLSLAQRINLVLLALAHRIAFLIGLAGAFFLVFAGVAFDLVGTGDVAGWIFTDPTSTEVAKLAELRGTWQSPWTRIALLLALLITVERMLRLLADTAERDAIFGSSDAAIRRRIAAWMVLCHASRAASSTAVPPAMPAPPATPNPSTLP